jgi:hypothetical protein
VSSLAQSPPPERHGKCQLRIVINGATYKLRRHKALHKGAKVWSLTKVEVPAGYRGRLSHTVVRYQGIVTCTCEDAFFRGVVCKHAKALTAAGIISGGKSLPPVIRPAAPAPAPSGKEVV